MQIHNGTPSNSSSISFHSILGFSSEFSDGCKHAHTHSRNNIKKKHKSLHEGKISIVNRKSNQCYIDGEKSVWAPRGVNWKLFSNWNMFSNYVRWMCHGFVFHFNWKTRKKRTDAGYICSCLVSKVFTFIWLTRYSAILRCIPRYTVARATLSYSFLLFDIYICCFICSFLYVRLCVYCHFNLT